MSLALAVLVASLLGSVHCAGMCGGFVCFYAGADGRALRGHAAYNLGRLASYLALGGAAGLLGAGVDAAARSGGARATAATAAGALMFVWGAARLARALGVRLPAVRLPGASAAVGDPPAPLAAAFQRRLGRVVRLGAGQPAAVRAGLLGAVTALLPCGWLWAFVATAAGTGRPAAGALVMAAFWAGTLPAMAAVGLGAQRLLGPMRRRLPALSAALLMAVGALTLAGKLDAAVPGLGPTHEHPHGHAHAAVAR